MALLCGVLLWAGCSIEKHYDVLSFFFDGVPSPGAVAESPRASAGGSAGETGAAVSFHTAFAERRCQECHGPSARFGMLVRGFEKLDDSTCLACHAETMHAPPRLHGPVAAGLCLWCHRAHESPYPHLLKHPGPELCLGCHDMGLLGPFQIPEHQDRRRDCLGCHAGHGGAEPGFLKPRESWPPWPASSAAAPQPPW
jgi:predicted CXXCH cytochrome family protein